MTVTVRRRKTKVGNPGHYGCILAGYLMEPIMLTRITHRYQFEIRKQLLQTNDKLRSVALAPGGRIIKLQAQKRAVSTSIEKREWVPNVNSIVRSRHARDRINVHDISRFNINASGQCKGTKCVTIACRT